VPDPTPDFCLLDSHQYGTNEFNENYVTFRVEGRFAIGVMYPTAINIVTGLPSSLRY
jgi:hypothetical protein